MDELVDVLCTPNQPPIVAVTGPTGVGRTTYLTRLRESLVARGECTVALRFSPDSDAVPIYLPDRVSDRRGSRWSPPDESISTTLERILATGDSVVLIDDAQWIDRTTAAALEQLARRATDSGVRCVCAVRVPAPGSTTGAHTLQRLRAENLLLTTRLRGMRRSEVSAELARVLHHNPDPHLVTHLHERSRGIPSALRDATDALQETCSIRLVGGRAYLRPDNTSGRYPRLIATILELGPDIWPVAKAAAVLHPLGTAMPRLLAEALPCTEAEAYGRLAILRSAGILHSGRHGTTWRFTVPLTVDALLESLGPYERRHLAETAVTAVWTGRAECTDDDYLADQIAAAGRLVTPGRARRELYEHSHERLADTPDAAARWLGAAAGLAEDSAQYVVIAVGTAIADYLAGNAQQCLDTANELLGSYAAELTDNTRSTLRLMAVFSHYSLGDHRVVRLTAEGRWCPPHGAVPDTATRAMALGLLDRWSEVGTLLNSGNRGSDTNEVSGLSTDCLLALADYWCGRVPRFEHTLPARGGTESQVAAEHRPRLINAHVTALLSAGELYGAERALNGERETTRILNSSGQAHIAAMRGDADTAVESGMRCVATDPVLGGDPGRAPMVYTVADLLIYQGRISEARALIDAGHAARPILRHLLDYAESRLARALGDTKLAAAKLSEGLERAGDNGLVVGAELGWSEVVELSFSDGDRAGAIRGLHHLRRNAERNPSDRAILHALLARATVETDHRAAADCLRLSRKRGQPLETAVVIAKLVRHGVGDPHLLSESYDIFGHCGALLARAWLRNLMREYDVVVPGRQRTLAENERLLGLLAAEGLTNKQLALTLRTSDKSVEGRMSRLFTRTGVRSRIELANALLTG